MYDARKLKCRPQTLNISYISDQSLAKTLKNHFWILGLLHKFSLNIKKEM